MTKRLQYATEVSSRTVTSCSAGWQTARTDVAADARFGGLRLTPQPGLVPLGKDPDSGLHEFAHPWTGRVPERDSASGRLRMTSDMAVVLVLIPGARGAGRSRGEEREVDAASAPEPGAPVALDPFFIGKFEMTQAQWLRCTGREPSQYKPGLRLATVLTPRNPVESVTAPECEETLTRIGMRLPTEAQWEHACKATTSSMWSSGDEPRLLNGHANIGDEGSANDRHDGWAFEKGVFDGHNLHGEVGTFRPNRFGLHDFHGNVGEWCLDYYEDYSAYEQPPRPGDGLRVSRWRKQRVWRGGSFYYPAAYCASEYRNYWPADGRDPSIGVRPVRPVLRETSR